MKFHVEDLMSSYTNKKVNDKFLKRLNMKYREHAEVTVTRGGEYKCLRMKTFGRIR